MNHVCPVCGYSHLRRPPQDHTICPSCGTEFGYSDAGFSHVALRRRWLASGACWWSPDLLPPPGWSAAAQLERAGLLETAVAA